MKMRFEYGKCLQTIALAIVAGLVLGIASSDSAEPEAKAKSKPVAAKTKDAKPVAAKNAKPKPVASKSKGSKQKQAVQAALAKMEPPAPYIDFLYPAGGQRGKTVSTTVTGTALDGISAVRITGSGVKVAIAKAVNPTTVQLSVTIAPDAELGPRDLRVTTQGGVSNRYLFVVGEVPETMEVEPNSTPAQAQRLESLPMVANGQIFEADRDYYQFAAKAGQAIVCEVQSRDIRPFMADAVPGWCDACLSLHDATGKELAYVDDSHLKPDPVLVYRIPKDGQYMVAVRDILYRGRGNFIYRLKIGVLPYLDRIWPLGGQRGTTVGVELHGDNLPAKSQALTLAADSPRVRQIQVENAGNTSNSVPFDVGDLQETTEVEPNDAVDKATRVETPITINGRIEKPGDIDSFTFRAKAGQRLVMEVNARRLNSPLDSILTLIGPKGQELAQNDDAIDPNATIETHHADSRLALACPMTGNYVLRIADVQGNGGAEYAYRLTIASPKADFAVRITPDNLRVGCGETTAVVVRAVREGGFNGEVKLAVRNLPPGFVVSEAMIPPGLDLAQFTITAPSTASTGVCVPNVVATAHLGKDSAESVTHEAVPAETLMEAFLNLHNVPTKEFSLAVVEASAFNVVVNVPPGKVLEVRQGGEIQVPVRVVRKEGAKVGLSLGQSGRPQGLTVKGMFLAPTKDEGMVTVVAQPQAPVGLVQNVVFSASLKLKISAKLSQSVIRVAPAVPIKIIAGEAPKK